jgi:hypothetical protein
MAQTSLCTLGTFSFFLSLQHRHPGIIPPSQINRFRLPDFLPLDLAALLQKLLRLALDFV